MTSIAATQEPDAGPRPDSGHPERPFWVRISAVVGALAVGLGLVMALFVSVAVKAEPNGIRLAVVAPAPVVAQIEQGIAGATGQDAFELSVLADEAEARTALQERTADGALIWGQSGPTLLTAPAASPAVATLLTGLAEQMAAQAAGTVPVRIDQAVVALPTSDPRGVGIGTAAFPMIIAGMALGAAAGMAFSSRAHRLSVLAIGAVVVGAVFQLLLSWLGVVEANHLAVAGALMLTIAAAGTTVAGLISWLGVAGMGVGALTFMLLANPLSGAASSPALVPAPWGAVGQWFPPGAGSVLLRTTAYFPEASVLALVLVLVGWLALGTALVLTARRPVVAR